MYVVSYISLQLCFYIIAAASGSGYIHVLVVVNIFLLENIKYAINPPQNNVCHVTMYSLIFFHIYHKYKIFKFAKKFSQ